MSVSMLAIRGGMPLGSLIAGAVASQLSPTVALLGMSVVLGATALILLISDSPIKKL
jgi:hypothetical protein